MRSVMLTNRSELNIVRPKAITFLCYLFIPLSVILIPVILLFPESFQELGPQYDQKYSYFLASTFVFYLVSLIGYWYMKKWSVYLYFASFLISSFIFYYHFGQPIAVSFFRRITDIVIILMGFVYIIKNRGNPTA